MWVAASLCVALMAAACTSTPVEQDEERLDTNTGTTVTVMPRPVELLAEQARATRQDPFAYVAPFETNRMGDHEMFLWIAAPQVGQPLAVPRVFCGDDAMALEEFGGSLRDMGLSSAPYKLPTPWSVQWYFRLSGEVLDCLASASRIRVETRAGEAQPESYAAEASSLGPLSAFLAKVRT